MDIFFLSYDEPQAEKNWQWLFSLQPKAKRVHGIKGIFNAHKVLANLSTTAFFFVVDGDAYIEKNFDFSLLGFEPIENNIYVWRSRNPINDLVYGNGGVKLICRQLFLNAKHPMGPDIATGISKNYNVVDLIASTHSFNASPYLTWRSSFREAVKLKKQVDNSKCKKSESRLNTWLSDANKNENFWQWAHKGAEDGINFCLHNRSETYLINDFDWLKLRYEKTYLSPDFNSGTLK